MSKEKNDDINVRLKELEWQWSHKLKDIIRDTVRDILNSAQIAKSIEGNLERINNRLDSLEGRIPGRNNSNVELDKVISKIQMDLKSKIAITNFNTYLNSNLSNIPEFISLKNLVKEYNTKTANEKIDSRRLNELWKYEPLLEELDRGEHKENFNSLSKNIAEIDIIYNGLQKQLETISRRLESLENDQENNTREEELKSSVDQLKKELLVEIESRETNVSDTIKKTVNALIDDKLTHILSEAISEQLREQLSMLDENQRRIQQISDFIESGDLVTKENIDNLLEKQQKDIKNLKSELTELESNNQAIDISEAISTHLSDHESFKKITEHDTAIAVIKADIRNQADELTKIPLAEELVTAILQSPELEKLLEDSINTKQAIDVKEPEIAQNQETEEKIRNLTSLVEDLQQQINENKGAWLRNLLNAREFDEFIETKLTATSNELKEKLDQTVLLENMRPELENIVLKLRKEEAPLPPNEEIEQKLAQLERTIKDLQKELALKAKQEEINAEIATRVEREISTQIDGINDDIQSRLNALEEQLNQKNQHYSSTYPENQTTATDTESVHWNVLTFYSPPPNQDKVFVFSRIEEEFIPRKTFFSINLKQNTDTEGELRLVNDQDTLQVAHNAPDTFLRIACEFQTAESNSINPNTIIPGEVVWNGKNWKLTKRIIIQ